jgi:chromosome segregation ATPase
MRTLSFAVAVACVLCPPLAAQATEPPPRIADVRIDVHAPLPLSLDALGDLCRRHETGDVARKCLRDLLADEKVYVGVQTAEPASRDTDGRVVRPDPRGTDFSFHLVVAAQLRQELSRERQEQLVREVAASIEQRLDAVQRGGAAARDQRRIDELEAQARDFEARYLELRKRAAGMVRADLQTAVAIAADLDKQRLNVELDLRTEQSVQQHLQDLLADAQKRRTEVLDHLRGLADKKAKVESSRLSLQKMLEGTKAEETERARQQLEELQQQVRDTETAYGQLAPDAKRQADLIDTLAEDARKSAMTVNRLATRFELLQRFAAEQQKALAEAEVAGAERDAALLRADDVKARMQSLRQRAEEIRVRLDAMEPVRLEIWK